ncbi:hypothetical protein CCAX7_003110 [Capsulimonas corticalis]|uniref:Uncharacterized protein n=1 Tax=Capsulimonas corticalis TaxID=2219043 RepID=A0A402CS60_9BACT|nr:GH92 family glycosyl hydrolase [Capsulimonas corticalis]BDI28260.1 hypothetical protein CCAX7_003110 [Capsulimonas corticalis]
MSIKMLALLFFGGVLLGAPCAGAAPERDFARWVDPFIGTSGAGATYPGAQAPFGMISPGPSTAFHDYGGGESRSGYQYEGKHIVSFALTHVSGVGLHAAQDLPFTVCTGDLNASPLGHREAYQSAFASERQRASPGFFQVPLETYGAVVSIASAARSSIVQVDYPVTSKANLLFCPSSCGTAISDSHLTIDPNGREISGWAAGCDFGDAPFHLKSHPYRVYFAARFDTPMAAYGVWTGDRRRDGAAQAGGADGAAYVQFNCASRRRVQMRVAISYVSVENARANLRREIPNWDFDGVRAAARRAWNALLGRMRVEGGAPHAYRSFYTALYHNALQPNIFDDVNGEYIGFDRKTHRVKPGHHLYATFSLWDTYRSTAALQTLLAPGRASDMAQSLLLASVQAPGGGLPTWPLNNNDTGCMGCYCADPFIANVYAYGGRAFDLGLAKERMILTATHQMRCGDGGAWWGVDDYMKLGWTPRGASETLELAISDFAIARICLAAGDRANYRKFLARSQNSFHVFNPKVGYAQSRLADGSWDGEFRPNTQRGFTEGCSAQYTWLTPHNYARLIALMGGPAATRARLDQFFNPIVIEGWATGAPHYWLGNEPTMQAPYLYNWIGAPWKAQAIVGKFMAQFRDIPNGYVGNDDVGTMSALYAFSALGLNPAIPGVGGFTLSAPIFARADIDLPGGKTLRIHAKGAGAYIQSLRLNGKPYDSPWLGMDKALVGKGARLDYVVSGTPNKVWGTKTADAPPSFSGPSGPPFDQKP